MMEDSPLNGRRRNQQWRHQKSNHSGGSPAPPPPSAPANFPPKKQPIKAWLQLWGDIERTLGIHGVRRVKPKRRNIICSILWILILLCVFLMFGFTIAQHIIQYLAFPTHWTVHTSPMYRWPGITICNLGPVSLTKFAQNYLEQRKREQPMESFNWTSFLENNQEIPSRELYFKTAQSALDMIVRCEVKGKACDPVRNFTNTLTPDGLCYTLRPDMSEYIEIWLNAESFDAFQETQKGLGFKLYIHEQDLVPIESDHFFFLSPGYLYDVTLAKESLLLLPQPHGSCLEIDNPLYNKNCQAECVVSHVLTKCKCAPFWSGTITGTKFCDVAEHFSCVEKHLKATKCACGSGCKQLYHSSFSTQHPLSDESLSQFYTKPEELVYLSRKYTQSLEKQAKLINYSKEKDLVVKFTNSCSDVFDTLNNFVTSVATMRSNLNGEKENMSSRIKFHTKVALEGMHKVVREGFSLPWRRLEEGYIRPLTFNCFELISLFDRTIDMLKTSTDNAVRRYLYTRMNNDLTIKLDTADAILKNLTESILHLYLNADPVMKQNITPEGRYDNALIPREIITGNSDTVETQYYNPFAQEISKYMLLITELQGLLRDVYKNSRLNETAFDINKALFTDCSNEINRYHNLFRHSVVQSTETEVTNKLSHFKAIAHDYFKTEKELNVKLNVLANFITSINRSQIENLRNIARYVSLYHEPQNITKTELMVYVMAEDTSILIDSLQEIAIEITFHLTQVFITLEEYGDKLYKLWEAMASEDSLNGFYFQLNGDVKEMQRDRTKMEYFLNLFTDERMLNISSANRSALMVKELSTLLNADIPLLHLDHKREYIATSIKSHIDGINYRTIMHQRIQFVKQRFQTLYEVLQVHGSKLNISASFLRENVLKIRLQHNPNYYTQWTHTASSTVSALFAQIGITLCYMLGASVLTFIEFCDILLSWLMNRECCGSPKLKTQSSLDDTLNKSLDGAPRHRMNRTPSYTTDSLQSRDTYRDTSRDFGKRPYVKFQECNNIRGSEV